MDTFSDQPDLTYYFTSNENCIESNSKEFDIQKLYTILDSVDNSEDDLEYFSQLDITDFQKFIGIYATELYNAHIKGEGNIDELGFLNNHILWSCIRKGMIQGFDDTNMRYSENINQQAMEKEYSISLEELQNYIFTIKTQQSKITHLVDQIPGEIIKIARGNY